MPCEIVWPIYAPAIISLTYRTITPKEDSYMPRSQLKRLFYAELLLNVVSIVSITFTGDSFLQGLGIPPSPLSKALLLWFVTMLVVVTWAMFRILRSGNEGAFRLMLEAYLIGDFVYLGAIIATVNAIGGVWAGTAIFSVVVTLVLIVARIYYLMGKTEAA
jgi:hypothetical protein